LLFVESTRHLDIQNTENERSRSPSRVLDLLILRISEISVLVFCRAYSTAYPFRSPGASEFSPSRVLDIFQLSRIHVPPPNTRNSRERQLRTNRRSNDHRQTRNVQPTARHSRDTVVSRDEFTISSQNLLKKLSFFKEK